VRRLVVPSLALLLVGAVVGACNGTTGDQLFTFPAYAAGATDAGHPFSSNGFTIQLTSAQMYLGAVYVNEAPAQNGSTFNTPACIDTGIYCAQVPGGVEVNLLSATPQPFSVQGSASADLGQSWQLYLVDGDVNEPTTFGVPNTADIAGTATRQSDGKVFSWAATITINPENRGEAAQNAGQPGANPICQQRIINFAGLDLPLSPGGSMLLTIDPRAWFTLPIDFSTLPSITSPECTLDQSSMYPPSAEYCIPDSSNLPGSDLGSEQGVNLFTGMFDSGSAGFALTYSSP
jgi:hypothetical protein